MGKGPARRKGENPKAFEDGWKYYEAHRDKRKLGDGLRVKGVVQVKRKEEVT
jgi:hypothetical protein